MPSPRVLKLADQIKGIAAAMLERRIKDPRLGFVTITDVRLTGDSREASIFYTVLGGDADCASSAAALQSATGLIRSQVGKQLGLKFTPTTTGFVKGLRYWRDASNTGTHTGTLYSASGQKLATLTFDDSGTGWQTASFSANVPVTAGTTYVAAYFAPKGH